MLSGANRSVYWLSHYIIDVLTHLVPAVVTILSTSYLNKKVHDSEYLFALFSLVNPLFLYVISF